MNTLNPIGQQFATSLAAARQHQKHLSSISLSSQKVHVVGAGGALASAYEQLRNAAEYTEEHLLLQRAIRRFYKRLFITNNRDDVNTSGEEIVTELTLAGYLLNDSVSVDKIKHLDALAAEYFTAYTALRNSQDYYQSANAWTIDVLSVEVETLLNNRNVRDVFLQFAFDDFLASIDKASVFRGDVPADYEISLYTAIHRALLKSDNATIRWSFLRRYQQTPAQIDTYIQANQKADELLVSKTSEKLYRIVDRRGATLRILWRMISDHENVDEMLSSSAKFLSNFEAQVNTEYAQMNQRINSGIIKSVIFLIITKFLLGIAIEVPYDMLIHGYILWTPLIINLLAPPIYMILLRFTLTLPSPANTSALIDEAETLFYKDKNTVISAKRKNKQYNTAFNVVYALLFIGIFGLVAWALIGLGFGALHLFIFFFFFSSASFFGFRLSRIIRELETVDSEQTGISLVRDFFYMPFVVVGRWMSDKYSRVNIVAMVLDMIIELPLKTILRLVRQWGAFIGTKKDEL